MTHYIFVKSESILASSRLKNFHWRNTFPGFPLAFLKWMQHSFSCLLVTFINIHQESLLDNCLVDLQWILWMSIIYTFLGPIKVTKLISNRGKTHTLIFRPSPEIFSFHLASSFLIPHQYYYPFIFNPYVPCWRKLLVLPLHTRTLDTHSNFKRTW